MSLATNISDAFVRVATECKSLRTLINGNAADLSALNTTAKSNLVAAINELQSAAAAATGIDDSTVSTTKSYSSSKTVSLVNGLILDSATDTAHTLSAQKIGTLVAGIISDAALASDTAHTFSAKHITDLILALINDSAASGSTTYSSTKINSQIAALISDTTSGSVTTWSSTKIASYVTSALGGYTQINDATTSTTSVWSSSKVSSTITTAISNLVNGAPTALDTLKEIADKLAADDTALGAILTSLDNRVRVDAAQTFTEPQKAQARTNIGAAGQTDVDGKVDYTKAQTLTTGQKTQAQQNINAADATAVGDTTINFVTAFTTALV